jgi:methyl-accepting chemotaxis protein
MIRLDKNFGMNLRGKIALLSTTLVVLGAGEGLFAILAMKAMNRSSQSVSLNSLPAIDALGRLDSLAKDARGKMRSHCVSTDKKEMAQIVADAVKLGEGFESEMASYKNLILSPEEARLRQAVVSAKGDFYRQWSQIEPVSSSGRKKDAMKKFLAEGMPAFQALQKRIAELDVYKKSEADRNIADAAAAARSGMLAVTAMVVLAVVCGAALSWLLVRWVKRVVGGAASQLGLAAELVTRAAADVSASSSQVSQSTVSQAASLEQTSAASNEVSATAKANADACTTLTQCMKRVESEMDEGDDAMQALRDSITGIVQSSRNISKVLLTIDSIAFQTNILALNAAVEAARAGQAGLGFAVVADEVRNLSLRCAEAARQTGEFIEESVRNASEGELRVAHATRVIASVSEVAKRAAELSGSVNAGSLEQASGVAQIAAALSGLEQINQRNAAGAEQSNIACRQLGGEAKSLRALVGELQTIAG